uniref:Uncharacterized protein n=1 Tax=Picea glauca TaxID=3330 RepID=A0A101LUT8_PICGL|nr:hypothetical protein ABT39_MTgene2311 [Picea glauca]QHR89288.1 hypothetical protein Q903MT_gene3309 [Picea sitchensis]
MHQKDLCFVWVRRMHLYGWFERLKRAFAVVLWPLNPPLKTLCSGCFNSFCLYRQSPKMMKPKPEILIF